MEKKRVTVIALLCVLLFAGYTRSGQKSTGFHASVRFRDVNRDGIPEIVLEDTAWAAVYGRKTLPGRWFY